jgi:hypothetical protein
MLAALSYPIQEDEMRVKETRHAYTIKINPSTAAKKENT